jgi:enoyl-CoA hydratase/carnithine racemase
VICVETRHMRAALKAQINKTDRNEARGIAQMMRAGLYHELTPFVEKLARRIASFPAHAIAHVKTAVDSGAFRSLAEGLLVEAHESDLSVASDVTQARVTEALKLGAETYEGDLEMEFLSKLSRSG